MLTASVLLAAGATAAQAADVNFSGFGTLGYTQNDAADGAMVDRVTNDGSYFGPSVLGIQADASLTEKLSVSGQARLAQDVYRDGQPQATVQFLFAGYQLTDDTTIRAGRLRAPFYMNSEFMDVGFVRNTATNPLAVYGQAPFVNYNGVDMVINGEVGDYEYQIQPYMGTEEFEVRFNATQDGKMKANYLAGVNASIARDEWKARVGYTIGEMDNLRKHPMTPEMMDVDNDMGSFMTAGVQYDGDKIFFVSEVANRSIDDALMMSDLTGYYATLGYRVGNAMPYVTYQGQSSADKNKQMGFDDSFTATGVGVRYETGDYAIKAEMTNYSFDKPNMVTSYTNVDSASQFTFTIDTTF